MIQQTLPERVTVTHNNNNDSGVGECRWDRSGNRDQGRSEDRPAEPETTQHRTLTEVLALQRQLQCAEHASQPDRSRHGRITARMCWADFSPERGTT